MATVSVLNMEGKEVGTMELKDAIFGVEVNENLVHRAVVCQLANKRRERRKRRRVPKSAAEEESRGDRRGPVMQGRVRSALRSGRAAASYLHRRQEITL